MCAELSAKAIQLYNQFDSLPDIARQAKLSITDYRNYGRENLLCELRKYRDQCVPDLRDRIESVISSVQWMGNGGDTQFYTFAFSNGRTKIEFIGIAIHKKSSNGLFDYTKYTYCFEKTDEEMGKVFAKIGISALLTIIFPPLGFCAALFSLISTVEQQRQQITHDTKDVLEACFMHELVKRGAAKVTNGRLCLLHK